MVCSGRESPLFNIVPGRLTDLAIGSRVRQSVSATNERTRIRYCESLLYHFSKIMQYSPTPPSPPDALGGDKNTVALFFEIGIRSVNRWDRV